ncbi:hypothetical protein ACFQ3W_02245 [Paenibacillus puldeungensis]|uniref:Lipoprotein n=1 Tax=Paenibacillus puldeungensis TaxID=696536 RepID=A0ABW3RRR4_9BACL
MHNKRHIPTIGAGHRRISIILLLGCLALIISLLSGCTTATDRQKKLYDNAAELVQDGDTYSYTNRTWEVLGDNCTLTFSSFNGMETLWLIHAEGKGKVTFDHLQQVDRGKFKLVVISPSSQVKTLAEGSTEGQLELKITEKGSYRIKVVGRGAKGKLKTSIHADEGIRVAMK